MDKIYVDTCIISGLVKQDMPVKEAESLLEILKMNKEGKVQLVTSNLSLDEINKIPDNYRKTHEFFYYLLKEIPLSNVSPLQGLIGQGIIPFAREDPVFTKLKEILPDETDQHHLYQAIRNSCDYFMTLDKKTILKYRNRLFLDICEFMVMSPTDIVTILSVEI